jgi:hypothetical protein
MLSWRDVSNFIHYAGKLSYYVRLISLITNEFISIMLYVHNFFQIEYFIRVKEIVTFNNNPFGVLGH